MDPFDIKTVACRNSFADIEAEPWLLVPCPSPGGWVWDSGLSAAVSASASTTRLPLNTRLLSIIVSHFAMSFAEALMPPAGDCASGFELRT
ncbi:hypothetical protein PMI06_008598 [Burkholderia sp. BT03]|nr:hypothetical protein PMI06_008598 [Burkholderia sp. BT03]